MAQLYGRKHRNMELIPADQLPDPVQWVWVIDRTFYSDKGFYGKRYALLKKNKGGGVTVIQRGYPKTLPKAQGRSFVFDAKEAHEFIVSIITDKQKQAQRRVEEMAELLKKEPKDLLHETAPPEQHLSIPLHKGKIKL